MYVCACMCYARAWAVGSSYKQGQKIATKDDTEMYLCSIQSVSLEFYCGMLGGVHIPRYCDLNSSP
jgi:hypothetical protein